MFRITKDQVALLRTDNIVSPQALAEGRTLRGLGIMPEPFETFVPSYLYRYRKSGQFAGTRVV
jgi:NADH dehydrogenase